ncbi:GSCFA domain-containing protein [Paracoccus methylovorus]|uniref:GSCFA domain-containing protein n=1 Tax=Paracoccus methylovorus TaxID=2812658 RepID=A0ABX7JLX8_9RHOB|nr:GSCFA domain-containing protein [Paracoccus methylovorus]QRZ13974.1 GSCFA domain-containing protein [Paracoccus methylovorus]
MTHPYEGRPNRFYWRTAVADPGGFGLTDLWRPKFKLTKSTKFITAGSCFAQHISRRLVERGYTWLDAEPGPDYSAPESKRRFNYGIFSFRTGNIYTAHMLLQWVRFAFGSDAPSLQPLEKDGRYYDPYRQQIEPDGFVSVEELMASREAALAALRLAFTEADVLLFTFGLTEAWIDRATGHEYSSCPGVVAGHYDPASTYMINHPLGQIARDFRDALRIVNENRSINLRVITTVSPVPLTATASNNHVLTATTYSKSVLRAVAGQLTESSPSIDYFPSYEVVTAPVSRGIHYEGNYRNVTAGGVDAVLQHFFCAIEGETGARHVRSGSSQTPAGEPETDPDVICDEVILDAFARR